MSVDTLVRPKIHWDDGVRANIGPHDEWFEEFDEALGEVDPGVSVRIEEGAETWYVINDSDVIYPSDPSPGLGLDTWNF